MDSCLKDRKICFVGDSRMQHIQHGVTSLIMKDADSHHSVPLTNDSEERNPATKGLLSERLTSDKRVGALETVTYHTNAWGFFGASTTPWHELVILPILAAGQPLIKLIALASAQSGLIPGLDHDDAIKTPMR